ncbi:hypothetical protein E2C01_082028 [Portunus trituberculatus]|uniref:Uncharacterized protein n=1 Tax=Portunus trituberculatus TaxID=210409 RepID=A0A5B7IZQ0_PORTR|nr:hypothetical protein [Portunus trituberculatus]
MRALGSEGSPSARVRILSTVRVSLSSTSSLTPAVFCQYRETRGGTKRHVIPPHRASDPFSSDPKCAAVFKPALVM